MAKLCDIIKPKDLKKLEIAHSLSVSNDNKVVAIIFNNLAKACLKQNLLVKMDGRIIKKVRIEYNNVFLWAKPMVVKNRLKFYYKNKCIFASDIFGPQINEYMSQMN